MASRAFFSHARQDAGHAGDAGEPQPFSPTGESPHGPGTGIHTHTHMAQLASQAACAPLLMPAAHGSTLAVHPTVEFLCPHRECCDAGEDAGHDAQSASCPLVPATLFVLPPQRKEFRAHRSWCSGSLARPVSWLWGWRPGPYRVYHMLVKLSPTLLYPQVWLSRPRASRSLPPCDSAPILLFRTRITQTAPVSWSSRGMTRWHGWRYSIPSPEASPAWKL